MEFEQEFNEDEKNLEVSGGEQDAADTFSGSDADNATLPAYDEVFSPVDEPELTAEAPADETDAVTASSEQPLDTGAANVEPSTDGPYVNVSTVSETKMVSPSTEGGLIELESRGPGETLADSPPSGAASAHTPNSHLSPHAQQMLRPTSDGGPSLARPIIIVRLADDQMEQLINETLRRSARRSEQTTKEVAQYIVDQEFWRRDCQDRAILGH
jgi:hypothetical protein